MEVRRCDDGHPPVTERERVIRLNGIGGVTFQKPRSNFRSEVATNDLGSASCQPARLGSLPRRDARNFRRTVMSKVLVMTEQFAERAN
ncbi:MAG: hypothetical protein DMF32_08990 [Verrucomicrobia bacterium]|nr:MAG: hypothetical protein DMF32_08990 [Verrucomicrobiota bacterium]